MKPTVGLIGLGLMGKPMGANILKAGFSLVVWNRTASRADDLVKQGAILAAHPREVASQADVLITIVSDPAALEEVLWGTNGAMDALRRGSIYIDSSTVSPDLARRAAKACAGRGVDFLDAPVTGGTWGGGEGRVGIHDRRRGGSARPRQAGSGSLRKKIVLARPEWSGTNREAGYEPDSRDASRCPRRGSRNRHCGRGRRRASSGGPAIEHGQNRASRHQSASHAQKEYGSSFPLRLMHKDLRLALELARQHGISLPAASAAYATYTAVKDSSKDDPDYAAVARFWDPKTKTGTNA